MHKHLNHCEGFLVFIVVGFLKSMNSQWTYLLYFNFFWYFSSARFDHYL